MKALFSLIAAAVLVFFATPARADKVAVLPFGGGAPRPELEQARQWTREAVAALGRTYATPDELVSAEAAIRDGLADTSQEHLAAGKLAHADWTVTARVEHQDNPPAPGVAEEGYTSFRIEVEAAQVATGRVESLSREILADDGPAMIGEMLALLLRPEGLANAEIPWERAGAPRPRPKPKAPAPAPVPPRPVAPAAPSEPPAPRPVYGAGAPLAIGVGLGVLDAVATPASGRGPTTSMTIGGTLGYARPEAAPGLELRANVTGQAVGPKAVEVAAGARYAFAPVRGAPLFVGPELLVGAHVASGAEKTARFLAHGAAFVAYGLGAHVQLEAVFDIAGAFGGSGALGLLGGTGRAVLRF